MIPEVSSMYHVSVPIALKSCERYGTEKYIDRLREIGAVRVLLSVGSYENDADKRKHQMRTLKQFIPFFQQAGFETGVWLWAFMVQGDSRYIHITSPNGAVCANQVCPSDEAFRRFAADYAADIAACGPDMILYDDDYRYGFQDCGLGCACENHRRLWSEWTGDEIFPEELGKTIFGGSGNPFRSAFLKANGHFMKLFAQEMRAAVDRVDPNIRIGLCACMDVWDFCGVSADEISILLAGKTKPFLRLIGAPYWSPNKSFNCRLQDVIELERMESAWCCEGLEIVSEGDCYPRPRFACSAGRLECFDIALRAAGGTDGILKYMFDYSSGPDYETGYADRHVKNRPLYEKTDAAFAGKTAVGVRVYEYKNKFETMTVTGHYDGKDDVQNTFFSPAAKLLTACSIPTVYTGTGAAGVVFGENARYLTDAEIGSGLIPDVRAAEILQSRGVDVGLDNVGDCARAEEEYFTESREYVNLNGSEFFDIKVKDVAVIESFAVTKEEKTVASYRYENDCGQRFLVFAFDGYYAGDHAFKQYARASQLEHAVRYFGRKLPAFLFGCPDAYLLCRENEGERSVLIGNFFDDAIENAVVQVGAGFTSAEFINCSGRLAGDSVVIEYIAPYSCAVCTVKAK